MHAEETLLYLRKYFMQNEVENIQYTNDDIEWYYFLMLIKNIILSEYSQFMRGRIQYILKYTSV
jgi:hypothetical protein